MENESKVKWYSIREILLPFVLSSATLVIGIIFYCYPFADYFYYKRAQFGDYQYQYISRKDNEVRASFVEKYVPTDDSIIIAAAKDVIKRVFEEEVSEPKQLKKEVVSTDTKYNIKIYRTVIHSSESVFIVEVMESSNTVQSLTINRHAINK